MYKRVSPARPWPPGPRRRARRAGASVSVVGGTPSAGGVCYPPTMNAQQIPDGLLRLGFPEWKARVAWDRSNRDANRAAEYLLTNGEREDGFWRPVSQAVGGAQQPVQGTLINQPQAAYGPAPAPAYAAQAQGSWQNPPRQQQQHNQPHAYGHQGAPAPAYQQQPQAYAPAPYRAPAPAPYRAPAPAPPPPERPLSSYTTPFVAEEPTDDGTENRFCKWRGVQAWSGPDVRSGGLVGHGESAAMEGRRFWPGEGVIPKYPNGCQDRCFVTALEQLGPGVALLGVFDGSGGENAEKVATLASRNVQSRLVSRPPQAASRGSLRAEAIKDAFLKSDDEVLRSPTHLWEDSAGCTGICCMVDLAQPACCTAAHVGDSRAIHYVPVRVIGSLLCLLDPAGCRNFSFRPSSRGVCVTQAQNDAAPMEVAWQSEDHESTERGADGHKLLPVPPLALCAPASLECSRGSRAQRSGIGCGRMPLARGPRQSRKSTRSSVCGTAA